MATVTLTSLIIGAWLVVVGLLYALFVPSALAMSNFLFIAAVLLMLALVVILKWRGSGAAGTIEQVLYDTEQPATKK